ncbi:unnamed protein product [Angiostrongylus costaricensis]|uniref:Peptidase A1 domain-containing protein n=1 Tax=Angiostrongylus costaricensis TaxID=334426 RepID=A0A0R3PGP7_ANGCS|nr:unnamed protein product [Angiostrongylus costaricensis]
MKIIIVLATLVVVLFAGSWKMETRSTGSFIAHFFNDIFSEFCSIVIPLSVQDLVMAFDTRSSDFWVVDATCSTRVCSGYFGIEKLFSRHKFDTTRSSTLSRVNTAIIVLYGSGWYDGPLVKDTISLAGVTIQQQAFFSAEDIAEIFGYMRLDGIIGLAWPALSMSNATTPIQNLLSNLDDLIFTVWLNTTVNYAMKSAFFNGLFENMGSPLDFSNNGLITFGGIDTANCNSDIHYVPLSAEKYWEFTIEDFSIGSFSRRRANKAISDISTSWIGAPFSVVEAVVSQTRAIYNTEYKFYSVDCSTMMAQPDLEFTINGVEYNVPSKQYVIDIEIGDGKCALALFEVDSGTTGYEWILGAPWIRTYCNIYDVGRKRVGFAKAKQQE